MPKSSGFMQGLNLNLGKEERKASRRTGLALNPSLLGSPGLAGDICAHRDCRGPAMGSGHRCGGLMQESVCMWHFQTLNPFLYEKGGQALAQMAVSPSLALLLHTAPGRGWGYPSTPWWVLGSGWTAMDTGWTVMDTGQTAGCPVLLSCHPRSLRCCCVTCHSCCHCDHCGFSRVWVSLEQQQQQGLCRA